MKLVAPSRPRALRRRSPVEVRRQIGVETATLRALQYVVVPLWMGAGLADWVCHRRSDIEHTAGTEEAAIHALMMTQAGIPATLGLYFEINAGVLLATLVAFATHQATAIWDVAYADTRREVTPTEQHVHGLLEQAPAMATAFLFTLHWDQARALVSAGRQRADLRLRLKRRPLSRAYRVGFFTAVIGLIAVPYGEELWRCARVANERGARAVTSEPVGTPPPSGS